MAILMKKRKANVRHQITILKGRTAAPIPLQGNYRRFCIIEFV